MAKHCRSGFGDSCRPGRRAADPGGTGQTGALLSDVQSNGRLVRQVFPRGAVVTKFGDRLIASGDALVAAVRSHAPGEQVQVTTR